MESTEVEKKEVIVLEERVATEKELDEAEVRDSEAKARFWEQKKYADGLSMTWSIR